MKPKEKGPEGMISTKLKFNMYERVAGLFVLTAIAGVIVTAVGVAVQKGWFERKIGFGTTLKSADGVRIGTMVQIAGLRAGAVKEIELQSDNEVRVKFEVSEKFLRHVREDSLVRVVRPFIIGEKVLEVSVGSETLPIMAEHKMLKSEPSADLMDLLNGRNLGPHLEALGKMMENLRFVAEALLDPERSRAMIQMFDELRPTVKNLGTLSRETVAILQDVNKGKKLVRVMDNLANMTDVLNKALPAISQDAPELAADLKKISHNTAILTDELQKTIPLMQDIGPELPRVSRRAIEALDETVVTLKALQRSFVLRGNIQDVRDEEAREREPASTSKPAEKKK
jgi:phospholipid/cholesterol/gamma-HCH transport system substrate-binding protein